MKLIQAMKQIKDLNVKAEDIRKLIGRHSADLNYETPVYPDTKAQIESWLQSHRDIVKEVLRLRVAIQRTNLETTVPIEIDGKSVVHTIAEWIHRRRDLAALETSAYSQLTDRNLKEGIAQQSTGTVVDIKIRRHYDPATRDKAVSMYKSEPHLIDATLEVTNAVTDLVE